MYSLFPDEVRGLIFDCDGTILDTMPLHWKAWCQICAETGLLFKKKDFYRLAGVPGKYIIRDLAIQQAIVLDPLEVYHRKKKLFLKGLSTVNSIPCVVKYVYEARQRGIPVAVATGSSRIQVEKALTAVGIIDLFDVIIGNEDYIHPKPSPDAFLMAAERIGVDPEDCWGFEDTDIGLEAIKAAGLGLAVDVRLMDDYPKASGA
ncbi:predicted protein [Nematostella vectensis]|uniref:Uncharacterized protein n=1 Tax=Nematostella vectensis TaxID=45351 RepID=A7RH83_NEMVE|nr:fructose-1-phosphate phosphatase YqaB [Nematostella vectensis]EDO49178.1 predicted protein [Nematostella vectensis]|eukprot:XP_001641241.1 predicted protein [Nematostella vectensis]